METHNQGAQVQELLYSARMPQGVPVFFLSMEKPQQWAKEMEPWSQGTEIKNFMFFFFFC